MGRKWESVELKPLRDALVELYDSERKAKGLVEAIGIRPASIHWEGSAEERWYSATTEVNKHSKLDELVAQALKEWPNDSRLLHLSGRGVRPPEAGDAVSVDVGGTHVAQVMTFSTPSALVWADAAARDRLVRALADAFPSHDRIEALLRRRFNLELSALAAPGPLVREVADVVEHAGREGWLSRLYAVARIETPLNEALQALEASPSASAGALHGITAPLVLSQDARAFARRQFEQIGRVCRIEVGQEVKGTGFLVGADLVLTNYHVMNAVILGSKASASVQCRFDYARAEDGSALYQGQPFGLVEKDWLVDSSPYDPRDEGTEEPLGERPHDRLDYALLRLAGAPGDTSALGATETKRGWVSFPEGDPPLTKDQALSILQHPRGNAIQLAQHTHAVIGVNTGRTRVRYRVNTEAGSSGSPVFDAEWNLVALHHCGDPDFNPRYNQGIPIDAIRLLLRKHGRWSEIGR